MGLLNNYFWFIWLIRIICIKPFISIWCFVFIFATFWNWSNIFNSQFFSYRCNRAISWYIIAINIIFINLFWYFFRVIVVINSIQIKRFSVISKNISIALNLFSRTKFWNVFRMRIFYCIALLQWTATKLKTCLLPNQYL